MPSKKIYIDRKEWARASVSYMKIWDHTVNTFTDLPTTPNSHFKLVPPLDAACVLDVHDSILASRDITKKSCT